MIDDPFDPPGNERVGGGHVFLFDLGRYLIRRGFQVTYIIRKNSQKKKSLEKLGEKCSIIRLEVGPLKEMKPDEVSKLINPLKKEFINAIEELRDRPNALHSIYWISGIVALDFTNVNKIKHVHSVLSLGRLKVKEEKKLSKIDKLRDESEIKIFNDVDGLILVCPNELQALRKLYPEVINNNCHIIPYGIDETLFFPRPESTNHYVRRTTGRFKQRS